VISQPDPGSPTYVIADNDGNELRLHAQHLAKFVAYANDRELSDAKHVDGSMVASEQVRCKKPIPAAVGSAPTLPGELTAVRSTPKKPEEKKALPLVSKILDVLPSEVGSVS